MVCRTACALLSGRSLSLIHPNYLQSKLGHLQHQDMPYRHGITMWPVQLQGGDAHLVLSLQHLPQGQRRFAPLGVLSCSDICAGLLYKLGPSLEPHQRNFLEQYKVLHDFSTTSLSSTRYYMTSHIVSLRPAAPHYASRYPTFTWDQLSTCCCSVHDMGQIVYYVSGSPMHTICCMQSTLVR